MKKGIIIIVIALIALVFIPIIYLVNVRNDFVRQENGIVAIHEDLQNVHASVFNQMKSQGLSVEKYGSMVIEALNVAMSGRYGEKGAQGAMLWIKEQNPTIDPKMFGPLQQAIEAGYNKFETAQRTKIDRIRVYDNDLESTIKGSVGSFLGFPKKVTADMRKTISSAETAEMIETKQMKTIDPFSKPAAPQVK